MPSDASKSKLTNSSLNNQTQNSDSLRNAITGILVIATLLAIGFSLLRWNLASEFNADKFDCYKQRSEYGLDTDVCREIQNLESDMGFQSLLGVVVAIFSMGGIVLVRKYSSPKPQNTVHPKNLVAATPKSPTVNNVDSFKSEKLGLELQKAQKMLEDGLLSQEEYQALRKKLIESL